MRYFSGPTTNEKRLFRQNIILSAFAGSISVLALPPLHILPFLWLSFPLLLINIERSKSILSAMIMGWSFGFGFFTAGLYWICNALLIDTHNFAWLIPFAILGFGLGLGSFTALTSALTWKILHLSKKETPSPLRLIFVFALLWTFFEWIRSWILTGFLWNPLGSVWVCSVPILQIASLTGVYGLSFITVLFASFPYLFFFNRKRAILLNSMAILALLAISLWGYYRSATPYEMVPHVKLRLVQGNIAQTLKWSPQLVIEHLTKHLRLTQSSGFEKITHVIWSETAAPSLLGESETARAALARGVPENGAMIVGTIRRNRNPISHHLHWYNSLQILDQYGDIIGTYDKSHLVPFGEYVPGHSYIPFNKITQGIADYSAGSGPVTMPAIGILPSFSPLICYEDIFPSQVVTVKNRPHWLLAITNDAWFGMSSQPWQHLAAAQLRAVEQGLPVIRVANTGISAVIDPYGRILSSLPLGTEGVIDSELPDAIDRTIFARYLNWFKRHFF